MHDESQTLIDDSLSFDNDLRGSGNLLAAHPLDQVRTAKALRTRDGNVLVMDGPLQRQRSKSPGLSRLRPRISTKSFSWHPEFPRRASEALKCVRSSKDRHLNTGKMRPNFDVQCHVQSAGDGPLEIVGLG